MSYKLLKIRLVRYSDASPEINVWNIFDIEHAPFVHGKRKSGEGMDPSYILYETSDMNLTIDTQRLPILSFIKYRTMTTRIATPDHSVIQYSSFFGVPTFQKYSAVPLSEPIEGKNNKYTIDIVFQLSGFWRLLTPVIRRYLNYWLNNTWTEDLVMKERRQKFMNFGFRDMRGLPAKVSERKGDISKVKLPLQRSKDDVISHPFCFKNISELFEDA